jgi:gas vesicle protein
MKNSVNILGALFLGMAVGAAIGILLAPAKGSETRKKLADGAKDMVGNLKDKNEWRKSKGQDHLEEYYKNIGSA